MSITAGETRGQCKTTLRQPQLGLNSIILILKRLPHSGKGIVGNGWTEGNQIKLRAENGTGRDVACNVWKDRTTWRKRGSNGIQLGRLGEISNC